MTLALATPRGQKRRLRLCIVSLFTCLALQLVLFCHLHVGASHHSSSVLNDSLEHFLGYSSLNTERNFDKIHVSNDKHGHNDPNKASASYSSALSLNATLLHSSSTIKRNIPDWLKEYIAWHKEQRSQLTPENWNSRKYLIMQCLESDRRCGGTADRLKPIPTLLHLAHQFQRLLFIRWERPCKLEEFLQPVSLDWRLPEWLDDDNKLGGGTPLGATTRQIRFRLKTNGGNDVVVRSRYQSYNGGADYYNQWFNSTSAFQDDYHNIWHSIFQPVPPLQSRIDTAIKQLSLQPGEYAAAHFRALYGVSSRPVQVIRTAAINAVNCASSLKPGGPIFFASDSQLAIQTVEQYALRYNRKIVSLTRQREPLHLEKANHSVWKPRDYYDTFVDVYLLGSSKCLAYNVGGFGTWGLLMGYNASCGFVHAGRNPQIYNKCNWVDA